MRGLLPFMMTSPVFGYALSVGIGSVALMGFFPPVSEVCFGLNFAPIPGPTKS